MSAPWPPPPDLESLKELFATADVEGLIADECPLDEYDPEAKHFFDEVKNCEPKDLTVDQTLPMLERIWANQFMLDTAQIEQRHPALLGLAQQIARFFGPEATPQVRGS